MLDIDQNILEKVHRHCPKCKVCLSGDMSFCGKVKQGGGAYLIMEPPLYCHSSNCPHSYKIKDKDTDVYVCACPVRKEIYRKYEI